MGYDYMMETPRDRHWGINEIWGAKGQPVLRKVKRFCSFVPLYNYGGPKSKSDWSKGCVDAVMTFRQYE